MKPLTRSIVLTLLLLPLAATPWTSAAPTSAEINRAIEQLGDSRFSTREEASAFLWRAGTAAEPALRKAARGGDPEVVARAQAILERLHSGIGPDTPREIVDLIAGYRAAGGPAKESILEELFERKSYAILKTLRTAARANGDTLVLRRVALDWVNPVPALLAAGEVAKAEELLEIGSIAEAQWVARLYAASMLLNGRLDEAIRRHEARARQEGADADRSALLAYLHRAAGDLSGARGAAEQSGDKVLLDGILYEQNDWRALSQRWQVIDPNQRVDFLALAAAYHRLAGDTVAFEKAVAALRVHPEASKASNYEEALVLNDRPEESLALLLAMGSYHRAFERLCGQMRYREAFALADRVESGAVEAARPEGSQARRRLAVAKAKTLDQLGEPERARQILLKVAGEIRTAGEPWSVYPEVAVTEFNFGLRDLAFEHLARILERTHALHKDDEHDVGWALSSLFPALKGSQGVNVLWKTLRREYPDDSQSTLLKRLRDVFDGASSRERLASLARDAEAMLAMIPKDDEREQGLNDLALGCEALGLDELAESCLKRSTAMTRSARPWEQMGCFLARKARWEQAADSFRRACEVDGEQPVYLARRGCMLVRVGRDDEGRALIDQARRRALAGETAYNLLTDAFIEHGLTDEARRQFNLALRIGEFDSWSVANACQELAIEAMDRKNYAPASALWDRRVLFLLRLGTFLIGDATVSLRAAALSHKFRAYARLAAGQVDPAIHEARLALALYPVDVEVLETLVPKLRALGRDAEVDQLSKPVLRLIESTCADYPRAAMHHNNLAWLSAQCRLDLDRGLEHARKAVDIDPDNVSYLDTLAEVQFLRGERAEAIAIMKRCIALHPQDRRLREQLDRFEAGGSDGR